MSNTEVKVSKNNNFIIELCILCQKKKGKLTSTDNGKSKIQKIASVKKDAVFVRIKSLKEGEKFSYHMTNSCYRQYVKNNVAISFAKTTGQNKASSLISAEITDNDETENLPAVRPDKVTITSTRSSTNSLSMHKLICIFCN